MARRRKAVRKLTPNQVVAFNLAKARLWKGWTQAQAAEAIAPYLGAKLSTASFSAMERSVDGGRIKKFDADELLALSRGFDLPIGWFLTPPARMDPVDAIDTPDAGARGLDPRVMLDAVLGLDDGLDAWKQYLMSWPSLFHRMRVGPDGKAEPLGRVEDDVHPRVDQLAETRAQMLIRERFGDIDEASEVLKALTAVLEELGSPSGEDRASVDTKRHEQKQKPPDRDTR